MSKSWLLVLSFILFAVGLFVIFRSVNLGSEAANAYLVSQGGGMDTAQFTIFLQEYMQTYRWIGSIMSIIGGLGLVKGIAVR
jgi:uncharacterized membrane protein